jgi:hypothetical protein
LHGEHFKSRTTIISYEEDFYLQQDNLLNEEFKIVVLSKMPYLDLLTDIKFNAVGLHSIELR